MDTGISHLRKFCDFCSNFCITLFIFTYRHSLCVLINSFQQVAPYEIFRIDKHESSTEIPVPYEADIEEFTQEITENESLTSDKKGKVSRSIFCVGTCISLCIRLCIMKFSYTTLKFLKENLSIIASENYNECLNSFLKLVINVCNF